jgi:hypothetical protein
VLLGSLAQRISFRHGGWSRKQKEQKQGSNSRAIEKEWKWVVQLCAQLYMALHPVHRVRTTLIVVGCHAQKFFRQLCFDFRENEITRGVALSTAAVGRSKSERRIGVSPIFALSQHHKVSVTPLHQLHVTITFIVSYVAPLGEILHRNTQLYIELSAPPGATFMRQLLFLLRRCPHAL